jgi:hypothetical protein
MPIDLSIPPAPDRVSDQEIWSGTPNVILDGEKYGIGWQRFSAEKGGPAYVTARRSVLGALKVVKRYPLTDDGWAGAWTAFAKLDPAAAEKTRVALASRSDLIARLSGAPSTLAGLVLSAVDPPAQTAIAGQIYDLRFSEDGLRIARSASPDATAEYRYADVAAVMVTGFERVPTGNKFVSAYIAFTAPGWMADSRYEYRTHLRVETLDRSWDFWHISSSPGADFSPWLEPVNRAIRQACISAAQAERQPTTEWFLTELARLAERLEQGTLTGADFSLLRAKIIGGI